MYNEEADQLNDYADRQINLWQRFFPNMIQSELNKAVISGLESKLALQMSHYVNSEKKDFLTYCGWVNKWAPQGDFNGNDLICGGTSDDDSEASSDGERDDGVDDENAKIDSNPVEERNEQLAMKEKEIADKANDLAQKEKEAADKEKKLADQEKILADKAKMLEKQEKAAAEKEKRLLEKERHLRDNYEHFKISFFVLSYQK